MRLGVNGRAIVIHPDLAIVAGFTGRDRPGVEAHLAELADLGVAVPASVPSFYAAPPSLLTQEGEVRVTHGDTSGEAEIALVVDGADRYITLVSDHTDRAVEARDIALSKLLCPKVVATTAWALEEVEGHLDALILRSWIEGPHGSGLYQEGVGADLIAPTALLEMVPFRRRPARLILLGGTLPTIGGILPAHGFRAELTDPVRGDTIELHYTIQVLDDLSVPLDGPA